MKRPEAATTPAAAASQNPNLKPLRTYETDVAEALAHRKTSTASIAIAENSRGAGEERLVASGGAAEPIRSHHMVRALLFTLLGLAIIGGGAGGGYYLFSHSPLFTSMQPPASAPQQPAVKSMVPADSQAFIQIDGLSQTAALAAIRAEAAKPQDPRTLKEIVLTRSAPGGTEIVPIASALNTFNIPLPDMVLRTLGPSWMLGVYADTTGNKTLVIAAKTDFFQNAFAGMLQWENNMPLDLGSYLNTAGGAPIAASFQDKIIKNRDVRALTGPDGQTLLAYSFVDNSTLVVAGTEAALFEFIVRLENQVFVR